MSITAYTGLPGSGKSYGVMQNVIIPALKSGRNVFTNIPVNDEKLIELYNKTTNKINYDDLKENPYYFQTEIIPGSVVIFDECWRLWPSGLKANAAQEGHKSFLAEHRHMVGEDGNSTEIVLVTQDLSQVASFARVLVETTFRSEKLSRVGSKNKFRIDVYHGPVAGANPPVKNRDRQIYGQYKKDVYELYSSHTMSKTGLAGNESKIDNRSNVLKSGFFIFAPILIIILGAYFYYGFTEVTDYYTDSNELNTTENIQAVTPNNTVQKQETNLQPEIRDFLSNKQIFIDWNNSNSRAITYIFRVKDGNYEYVLKTKDIQKMGYELESITQCLVFLKTKTSSYVASCEKETDNKSIFAAAPTSET